jgi:hypothetical protein
VWVLLSGKGLAVIVELSGELFAINTGKTIGMNEKQLSPQGYPKGACSFHTFDNSLVKTMNFYSLC